MYESLCHQTEHSNKAELAERDTAKPHFSEVLHAVVKQTNTNKWKDTMEDPKPSPSEPPACESSTVA